MPEKARKIIPVVVSLVLLAIIITYIVNRTTHQADARVASGYIEAVQVHLAPEVSGRITEVLVNEGQPVKKGDILIKLDSTLVEAQYQQAAAAAWAARSNAEAAMANYRLLESGASDEQLAVAQAGIDIAQINVDAAQETYDAIPENLLETASAITARLQLDRAIAALDAAQAQFNLVNASARPEQLEAAAAQSSAAAAQAAAADAALLVASTQIDRFTLTAPMDGIVLERAVQAGEFIAPGGNLLILADLNNLTLTLYIPEDQYGQFALGQEYAVRVDSFPDTSFSGRVSYISDQAEFTPRNVQTAASRKTTVFAIRLSISNPDGELKPGMPADVYFGD